MAWESMTDYIQLLDIMTLSYLELSLPGVEVDSSVIPTRPNGVVNAQEDDHMFAFQLIFN